MTPNHEGEGRTPIVGFADRCKYFLPISPELLSVLKAKSRRCEMNRQNDVYQDSFNFS